MQTKLLQHPLGREEISQQYQPNGIRADARDRNIFDTSTLVGSVVQSDIERLGIKRTQWEINGGLGIVPLNKVKSWEAYQTIKDRPYSDTDVSKQPQSIRKPAKLLRTTLRPAVAPDIYRGEYRLLLDTLFRGL